MTQTAAGPAANGAQADDRSAGGARPRRFRSAARAQRRAGAAPRTVLAAVASRYGALSPRCRTVAQDTGLAAGLAVLNLLSLLPYRAQLHPSWLALLLVAGQCLPLALRRVVPVPAMISCGLTRNVYDALQFGFAPLPLAPAIGFATVAERSGRLLRWITVAGTAGGIAWSQTLPRHTQPYDSIVQAFIFGAAWAVGTVSRYRRADLAAAASRAARAEAALDAAAAGAAAAERVRIARELHDVVAHHVSLIAVQAEAVGALLPARPETAAESADLIGATARTAMTELRRLLGVLRFTDHPAQAERGRLTPVPSLSRLDELTEAACAAGLRVTCEVSGSLAPLPPGIDLTAYRIVQEALTNARRHAPGSAAVVRLDRTATELSVEVANTAPVPASPVPASPAPASPVPASPAPASPGYGLAGIAERVASCRGALELGPTRGGGFTVTARLPLNESAR